MNTVDRKVFRKILDSLQPGRKRYVKIRSVHLSGISYLNIGNAGLEFLEDLSKAGVRFRVRTTVNPGCVDFDAAKDCDPQIVEKQSRIVSSLRALGASPSLTCIPYSSENPVGKGWRIAWAESSAVLYANSILGAYTNKEGSLTALASAILGYTARIGIHRRNGRKPELLVEYRDELRSELDYGLLGYVLGLKAGSKIPYLRLRKKPSDPSFYKQLLASFGTSGGAPMVWIDGVTPGSLRVRKPSEKITIGRTELEEAREKLSEPSPPSPGERIIFVSGCPHLSSEELEAIRESFRGIKNLSIEPWFFTSRETYVEALNRGLLKDLFEKGAKMFKDSCVMYCGLKATAPYVVTNSVKAAYYIHGNLGLRTLLKSLKEVVEEYGVG
ncbi:MAG: aconitase X [Thermoproteota archaeon]